MHRSVWSFRHFSLFILHFSLFICIPFACGVRATGVRGLTPTGSPALRIASSLTRTLTAGLVIALAIAAFLSPFASSYDDGLETVLAKLNIERNLTGSVPGIFADYETVPVPVAAWQTIAVSIAGIGGTLAVFVLAWLLGKALPVTPSMSSEAAGE